MVHEDHVRSSDLPFNSTVVQHSTTEQTFILEAQRLHIVESNSESVGKELQQCVVSLSALCWLKAFGIYHCSILTYKSQ